MPTVDAVVATTRDGHDHGCNFIKKTSVGLLYECDLNCNNSGCDVFWIDQTVGGYQ